MSNKLLLSLLAGLVLVLGIFAYLNFSQKIASTKVFEKEVTKIENVSESNEIDAIEEDLNQTDLENLDQELTSIETELN